MGLASIQEKIYGGRTMKKSIAFLVMLMMLFSLLPASAFAAAETKVVSLEKAIEIAKGFFPVPNGYDQFEQGLEQNMQFGDIWNLRWYKANGGGDMNVRVDAKTGDIVGYSSYDPSYYQNQYSALPKIAKKEAEKIASAFIKKVASKKADSMVLKPNPQNYFSGGPVVYSVNFVRTINNIEFPSNNMSLEIDGKSGQVRNYSCNWDNTDVKPVDVKITPESAQKIFNEKIGTELKYYKPSSDMRTNKPIMLVYDFNNPMQVAIDAQTGDIIFPIDYYSPYYGRDAGGMTAEAAKNNSLSPAEQKAIDEMKNLITKEQALEIAKKYVKVTDQFKLNYSALNKDYQFPNLKIWSFNWNLEDPKNNIYLWANAEVNAETGKILAFDYSVNPNPNIENDSKKFVIKDRTAAKKVALDYIASLYPETKDNIREAQNQDLYLKYQGQAAQTDNQPNYYFNFERLVNGTPFSENFIYCNVDSTTEQVTNFRIRFVNDNFPKTDKVIPKDKFVSDYFAKNPLQIAYVKHNNEVKLVYKLKDQTSFRYDAFTGNALDWNGEVIKDSSKNEIKDIAGTPNEIAIQILNDINILRVVDGKFNPKNNLSQAELIKMITKGTNSYLNDQSGDKWYEPYYNRAKELRIITDKEINPNAIVTREDMAKLIVRSLVWDKAATLDIYNTSGIKDAKTITKGNQGYVVMAVKLGLLDLNNGNFAPKAPLTKGDACKYMVNYLNIER
jgi:uncharacterized membrane protein YkoI